MQGIPDVERSGHTFSDGCGEISPELLSEVLRLTPFGPRDMAQVTTVQVRLGQNVWSIHRPHC